MFRCHLRFCSLIFISHTKDTKKSARKNYKFKWISILIHLKRKLFEIYLQSVIFFSCVFIFIRNGQEEKKHHTLSFCKILHPIKPKELKRLRRRFDSFVKFFVFLLRFFFQHFSFHSLSRESFFMSFLFLVLLQVPGDIRNKNNKKYIHIHN